MAEVRLSSESRFDPSELSDPPSPHPPSPSQGDEEGILDLGDGGGIFSGLLDAYERRGFERGYRQAVHDVMASLVWLTEEFLRDRAAGEGASGTAESPADLRRLAYAFEEHLERHLQSMSHDSGYVSEGLGI